MSRTILLAIVVLAVFLPFVGSIAATTPTFLDLGSCGLKAINDCYADDYNAVVRAYMLDNNAAPWCKMTGEYIGCLKTASASCSDVFSKYVRTIEEQYCGSICKCDKTTESFAATTPAFLDSCGEKAVEDCLHVWNSTIAAYKSYLLGETAAPYYCKTTQEYIGCLKTASTSCSDLFSKYLRTIEDQYLGSLCTSTGTVGTDATAIVLDSCSQQAVLGCLHFANDTISLYTTYLRDKNAEPLCKATGEYIPCLRTAGALCSGVFSKYLKTIEDKYCGSICTCAGINLHIPVLVLLLSLLVNKVFLA